MNYVSQLLKNKGSEVWSVTPDATVLDALKVLSEKNIGAVVVVEGEKLCGIFSERDYARKVTLQGKASKDTKVSELMSKEIYTVTSDDSVENCMDIMTQKHIRHLPVVDKGKITGMITIGDVVNAIISESKSRIDSLEKYIYMG